MHDEISSRVLDAWTSALGAEHVWADPARVLPYEQNVSGLQRRIAAVVRPASTGEVQQVVAVANRFGVPLYPISRGRNWGLGSRLPARDRCVVVDLSRMDRIREVNAELGYAVVEPGVTQRQLHAYLREHHLPFVLNVIGSALDSSMLGNALERGIGYFASRANSLSGLEVVLGDGTLLKTGFSHYPTAQTTHVYRYGIGPSLDGLFFQSNYGIVCAAGIELIRSHGRHQSVVLRLARDEQLPGLVDGLADLRRREVIRTVVHIGNRARTFCTLAPLVYEQMGEGRTREAAEELLQREGFGPWSAVGGLRGTPGEVAAAVREVKRVLRGRAEIVLLDEHKLEQAGRVLHAFRFLPAARRKAMILRAMAPIYGLSQGVPTDAALASVYWAAGQMPPAQAEALDPDQSQSGQLYFLPMLPLSGAVAREAVSIIDSAVRQHGLVAPMTLNLLDERCLEIVLSLAFRRDRPEQVDSAHRCLEFLEKRFLERGWPPYRVGLQSMPRLVQPGDPFWETARRLKQTLDPKGIIAPGRYALD